MSTESPDFATAPAWFDRQSTLSSSEDLVIWAEDDPDYIATFYPFTPLRTAEAWVQRIDRDKLAEVIDRIIDPENLSLEHISLMFRAADAVLAALPELMGGEQA